MNRRYGWMAAAGALAIGAGVALASPAGTQAASSATPWVHVRVEEPAKESRVNVNLPLTVVQAVLAAAPEKVASEGRFHVGSDHDLKIADLRKIWAEMKNTGDTDMVTVDSKDEKVRVSRRADRLEINVDKTGGEKVLVQVPVAVVDALLSGQGEQVDVAAALRQLQQIRGDIVTVHDEHDTTVRIWIDEGSK